jgi:HEPN domain-containing protein
MDQALVELLRDWLNKASEDLSSAEILGKATPPQLGTALFHCQQASEKVVKAVLTHADVPFEKTHDITELLRLSPDRTRAFEPLRDSAGALTPYAIVFRYPGLSSPPTQEQFARAFADAREFMRVALSVLPDEVTEGFTV